MTLGERELVGDHEGVTEGVPEKEGERDWEGKPKA